MKTKKSKKFWETDVFDIAVALIISVFAYFIANYTQPQINEMFATILFILVLILLKVLGKK